MEITVNGEAREAQQGETIADLLSRFNIEARMVVVEHNGEIVARASFANTPLAAGDVLEIVQMMAGG